MKRHANFLLLFAALSVAMVLPATVSAATISPHTATVPAAAQEEPHGENQAIPLSDQAKTVLVWSIIAIAVAAGIGAIFYQVKKKVGGFPESPSWVAPITVMPSRELPDEGDFGDQVPSEQAHAEH